MAVPKIGKSKKGKKMHYSVGAIIFRRGEYLLIDRNRIPLGFASLAGHVDDGETVENALIREVKEESGLDVVSYKLVIEKEVDNNSCAGNINVHYWYVFNCRVKGRIRWNKEESKSIGWFSKTEIKRMKLEPIWKVWFFRLNIL